LPLPVQPGLAKAGFQRRSIFFTRNYQGLGTAKEPDVKIDIDTLGMFQKQRSLKCAEPGGEYSVGYAIGSPLFGEDHRLRKSAQAIGQVRCRDP